MGIDRRSPTAGLLPRPLVAGLLLSLVAPALVTATPRADAEPATALPPAVLAPEPPAPTAPVPSTSAPRSTPAPRGPASSQAPAERTTSALTQAGEYLDTCRDVSGDALDLRRTTVGRDGDVLELSFAFCDVLGGDALALGSRSIAVATRTTAGAARQVTVRSAGGGVEVEVTGDGTSWSGPGSVRTDGPSPRLVARVPTSVLAVDTCGSGPPTSCLGLRIASFTSSGTATDEVPQAGAPSIAWPARCVPALGLSARADARVVEVAPDRQEAVRTALVAAGYPTAELSPGRLEVQGGVTDPAAAALAELAGVEQVTPVPARTRAAVPDDPGFQDQWALARLRMAEAWDVTTGSPQVRVAVVDDGIDGRRPSLHGAGGSGSRVLQGWDGLVQRVIPAGADSDLGGHGTAVAGLVAATGDDGRAVAGVDWQAGLVPIRVFDHEGCFVSIEAYLQALERLVEIAEDPARGVDVVNLSLGGPEIAEESALVRRLVAAGAVVVAATGNEGDANGTRPAFPAALPEVVGVGATRRDDALAGYSNRGRHVDMVAPGGDQSGTADGDVLTLGDPTLDGELAALAGTSFSTPLVSGLASLYRARYPDATTADVVRALLAGSQDLGTRLGGWDPAYGFGLPDGPSVLAQPPGRLLHRLAGDDRYATAAAASRRAFPAPGLVDTVLLATGAAHPDALAGGPLAARSHAPLLLTLPDRLPDATVTELRRLDPSRVVLLGGEAAIGPQVAEALTAAGVTVDRVAGANRYDTAAQVAVGRAGSGATWHTWPASEVVVVATGESFPDALTGGSAAAAAAAPLLLTLPDRLPAETAAALDRLAPSVVVVLGGTAAVADPVLAQIRGRASAPRVVRAAGADRYETGAAAACADEAACLPDTRFALLATGEDFADALGGAAAAAALRAPLLLVPGDGTLPGAVRDRLLSLEPEQSLVLGGPSAVSDGIASQVAGVTVR